MPLFDLDSGWLWKDTMETKSAARDNISVMTVMMMMLFVQKIEKDDLKQRSFMGFAHFWHFQAKFFLGIPFNINRDGKDIHFKECMYKGCWNSSVLVRIATFFVHCTHLMETTNTVLMENLEARNTWQFGPFTSVYVQCSPECDFAEQRTIELTPSVSMVAMFVWDRNLVPLYVCNQNLNS